MCLKKIVDKESRDGLDDERRESRGIFASESHSNDHLLAWVSPSLHLMSKKRKIERSCCCPDDPELLDDDADTDQ